MTDLITLYTPELLKSFVTLTALLFGANILQAIAAISRKGQGQDTILELHHAYKDLSAAIAERDQAKAEAQRANHLRDECEKTMRAAMEENDRLMIERATLYFRNAKGQIKKLS
jgi:biopolymer transport protein ExbB/TolQ